MKLKGFILVAIFSVLAALSLSQSNIVSAQTQSGVTSPVTYFSYVLRGRITYRVLNWIFPATNMSVVAKNHSGEAFYAKTDYNGFYSLTVRQASASAGYMIAPVDGRKIWKPSHYRKMVSGDLNGLNFVGYLSTASAQPAN